ncbi:MAG TPA: GAF domain-containing protein [Candidatus Sulfotelmatobacter sp.]|nr:GAF domain-containing protein [Candidatus Sulfotelmatobacter sp.]
MKMDGRALVRRRAFLEENSPSRRQGVSAALAAQAAMAASVRFPGEDGGRSLAEMAQSDLDAALQLLADRAQYITGASGAAIALRRDGRHDMLCRASSGTNAPELGALLSTEFGLSGESVRTRQLLRCDDAERDARVNREVCRQMGIASVLVMPVVNDDQVLGVFELFSGKAHAFGERDLSAVQRLSEMVETAVRLAHAVEILPQQLSERESSIAEAVHPEVFEGQFLSDLVVEEVRQYREDHAPELTAAAALESPLVEAVPDLAEATPHAVLPEPQAQTSPVQSAPISSPNHVPVSDAPVSDAPVSHVPVSPSPAKKLLFWSAADEGEVTKAIDADQSHVPPVLRGLRKCEACGFPISGGRVLCVECEEKKWRGQLRPQAPTRKLPTGPVQASKSAGGAFSAAAVSMAKAPEVPIQRAADAGPKVPMVPAEPGPFLVGRAETLIAVPATTGEGEPAETPQLILSAGLEPSRSWFSANKYIVVVLLVIGLGAAAFLLLR